MKTMHKVRSKRCLRAYYKQKRYEFMKSCTKSVGEIKHCMQSLFVVSALALV